MDILNYLLTSDFDDMDDAHPEKFKEFLKLFRYEYRLLSSKNTALKHEIDKLKHELDETKNKLDFNKRISDIEKAKLEDELYFTKNELNRKLSLSERMKGFINRKKN
jgi:predicted nuclease with TOPRIM domain